MLSGYILEDPACDSRYGKLQVTKTWRRTASKHDILNTPGDQLVIVDDNMSTEQMIAELRSRTPGETEDMSGIVIAHDNNAHAYLGVEPLLIDLPQRLAEQEACNGRANPKMDLRWLHVLSQPFDTRPFETQLSELRDKGEVEIYRRLRSYETWLSQQGSSVAAKVALEKYNAVELSGSTVPLLRLGHRPSRVRYRRRQRQAQAARMAEHKKAIQEREAYERPILRATSQLLIDFQRMYNRMSEDWWDIRLSKLTPPYSRSDDWELDDGNLRCVHEIIEMAELRYGPYAYRKLPAFQSALVRWRKWGEPIKNLWRMSSNLVLDSGPPEPNILALYQVKCRRISSSTWKDPEGKTRRIFKTLYERTPRLFEWLDQEIKHRRPRGRFGVRMRVPGTRRLFGGRGGYIYKERRPS